jgi:putative ABC transport system permease protein
VPRGSLDPEAIAAVVAIPGIANYSTSRRTWLESASGRTRIIALGMAPGSYAGTRLRAGDAVDVWRQFDNEDAILVSDAYAYRFEVDQGDKVELNTARGPTNFNIAAIYQSYDSDGGAIMMSRRTYDRYFDDSAIDSIGLYLDDDVAVDSVIDAIRRAEGGGQELVTSSNSRIRELSLRIFDRTFVITNVLYWLAVGVAIIGILGAMLALQLERTKEFGVLRAIGMTPWQTGLLVSVQTGFIGLLGGIASIPLGLVMAWVLLEVINRRAFGWYIDFGIQPAVLGWAIALSVGAALIGGIYPALRAAHTSPAHAMREE